MYHDKKSKSFLHFVKFLLQIVKIVHFLVFERLLGTMKVLQFVKKTCKMYCLFSEFKIIFEKYNFLQIVKKNLQFVKNFLQFVKIFYNL